MRKRPINHFTSYPESGQTTTGNAVFLNHAFQHVHHCANKNQKDQYKTGYNRVVVKKAPPGGWGIFFLKRGWLNVLVHGISDL